MNKRIIELAYAAKLDEHMLWTSDKGNVLPNEMIKFAELIVKECAEFANEHNSEAEGVTLGVGLALKKHFGVEE